MDINNYIMKSYSVLSIRLTIITDFLIELCPGQSRLLANLLTGYS